MEELAHNAALAPKQKPMDFIEFRQVVQDEGIKDVMELHRATNNSVRLDIFVNDMKKRPADKLACALESIFFRTKKVVSLVKLLLRAQEENDCICQNRTFVALKEWYSSSRLLYFFLASAKQI